VTEFIVGLLIAALIALGLWVHFAAPCGFFKYAPTKEIPARCLNHFTK
jgi:hypothetical protein